MKLFIAHYEKGSVYEPAEGGYYTEVAELIDTTPVTESNVERELRKLANELAEERGMKLEAEGYWTGCGWTMCLDLEERWLETRNGYIGEGEYYTAEREDEIGSNAREYEGYC